MIFNGLLKNCFGQPYCKIAIRHFWFLYLHHGKRVKLYFQTVSFLYITMFENQDVFIDMFLTYTDS